MDAFDVLDEVLGDYRAFVQGFLNVRDARVLTKVEQEIADGLRWPEPWLALNPGVAAGWISWRTGKRRRPDQQEL